MTALFSWGPAGAAGAAVPGPSWLLSLLRRLPLGAAAAQAWACRFCAALLSCLRHFHCFATLGGTEGSSCGDSSSSSSSSSSSGQPGWAALPRRGSWNSRKGEAYQGEWVRRLAYPLCPAAIHVLQWAQLRLRLADLLLPGPGSGGSSDCGGAASAEARQGKRRRLGHGGGSSSGGSGAGAGRQQEAEDCEAQQAQQLCEAVLGGALGESLAEAAGGRGLGRGHMQFIGKDGLSYGGGQRPFWVALGGER